MISTPLLLVGSSSLMVVCAGLLFANPGAANRQMRERLIATRESQTTQSLAAESLLYTPVKQNALLKLAHWLGYRSDLPPAFAASPKIVVPLAALIGVLAFNLSEHVISQAAALGVALFVSTIAARFMFKRKSKAYTDQLFKQIPDAMSLMLRAVRAGLPVAEAIRSVGRESMSPTRDEFSRVAGEAALGSPIEVAMRRLADRTTIQEYAFFSVIIGLHAQTGGNLAETLENMADIVRRRVAMAAKGRALSAEGRLSAVVVGALPFVVGLLMFVFNPGYLNEFVTNPGGPKLLCVFAGLLSTGLFVTHLMIQKSGQD